MFYKQQKRISHIPEGGKSKIKAWAAPVSGEDSAPGPPTAGLLSAGGLCPRQRDGARQPLQGSSSHSWD